MHYKWSEDTCKQTAKYDQNPGYRAIHPCIYMVSYLYLMLLCYLKGMKIPNKSKDDLRIISEQMAWLESHQHLVHNLSKEDGRQRAEGFALQVFQHGDDEDRAGLATKKTALNFHAAYVLMDICRQFSPTGDLASDLEEKQRYAIVKAADINKALKEGRKPKAGPLVEPSIEQQNAEDEALLATLGAGPSSSSVPSSSSLSASAASLQPASSPADGHGHFNTAASPFPTSSSSSWTSHPSQSPSSIPSSSAASNPYANFQPDTQYPSQTGVPASSASSFQPPSYPPAHDFNPTPLPQVPFASSNPYAPSPSFAPSPSVHRPEPSASFTPSSSSSNPPPSSAPPTRTSNMSPFSPEATAARNAAGGSATFGAKKDTRKIDSVRDAERLIKHALSAVVFQDIDTTVLKLKEALNLLQPHSTK